MAKRDTLITVRVYDYRGEFWPVKIVAPASLIRRFSIGDLKAKRSLIIQAVAKYEKELSEMNEVLIAEGKSPSRLCPILAEVTEIEILSMEKRPA